ncbi:MAG TPA: hypothetical protein VF771_17890, partial [Longimicrobiaceae bacterium]
DLAAAARFSSLFPSLSPLDPASRALWVDGVRFTPVRLPGGARDPLGTAAFAFRWLEMAELSTAPADVEWWGGSGAFLHALTRGGTKDVSAAAEGVWAGSSLGSADGFPSASVSGKGMEGGALLSGSLGGSAGGGFALGAEVRRMDTPLQLGTRGCDFAAQLAAVALDSFGITLREQPQLVRTELASAFGRVDAPLGGGSTLAVTAAGSTLLSPEVSPTAFLGGGGGSTKGSDAFAAATVTARLSDDAGVEVRATGSTSSRTFAAGDTAAGVALTRVLSGAFGFGAGETVPGRFARTEAGGTAAFFVHAGAHQIKAGGGAAFVHHDRAYAPASAGVFTFSDADAFARGTGTFTQTVGARPTAAFSLPRFSAFVQDTWSPMAGVAVTAGVRYDMERYPASEVRVDSAWAFRSGMITSQVASSGNVIQPRLALTIDPGARHEWLLRAEGGIYAGESDPGLIAEAVGSQSSLRVRRGLDVPWARTSADTAAAAAVRTLSILNEGWAPPRTARAMGSISRALPGDLALHLAGGWSRSEFLPRRADLNRLPSPVAQDQYGRPLYGVLVQRGGLLVAQPGSGRTFSDFEQVSALNVDGWLEWTGVSVEAERRPAAGLRLLANYTFSRTRDNLPSAWGTAPGDIPTPFAGDSARAGWDEGRSGFDIPHRAVAMAEWRGGGSRTPALALVYRFRSGDPFTAGFRQGVDANGDGSAANDPAFLDPGVSGFQQLASSWSCLSATGAFAVRNACRGPDVHALDVRVGMDLFRAGQHAARLTLDGLNLVGGETGPLDNAVYLVDPARSLTTDAQGRVVVPLVANPDFGKPLLRRGSGRTLRVSLQLAY